MKSKAAIWAILGFILLGSPAVGTIMFPSSAVAETLTFREDDEADRLFLEGSKQYTKSKFEDAFQAWNKALEMYRRAGKRRKEGYVMGNLGVLQISLGKFIESINYLEKSVEIVHELQDREAEGRGLSALGIAYWSLGKYSKAIELQQKSLDIAYETKNQDLENNAIGNLGLIYGSLGNFDKEIEYQEKSLKISREMKNRESEGKTLTNLGAVYYKMGNYPKSITYQQEALELFQQIKSRVSERSALSNLGSAYSALGDYDKAITYKKKSLEVSRDLRDRLAESESLVSLGDAYELIGNYPKALEYYTQSLSIAREIESRINEYDALRALGSFYHQFGDYSKALDYAERSLSIARELNDKSSEGASLNSLASINFTLGNYSKVVDYAEKSLLIAREIKDPFTEAKSTLILGKAYLSLGDRSTAIEYLIRASNIAYKIKNASLEASAMGNLAELYLWNGNYSQSMEFRKKELEIARRTKDLTRELVALGQIAKLFNIEGEKELAITFYKQSVNISESIRQNNQKLDENLQISYDVKGTTNYRRLAEELLEQDRIIEALQVLDLLKVKDLQDFLKDSPGNKRSGEGIGLLPQETSIVNIFNNLSIDVNTFDINTFMRSSDVQTQVSALKSTAISQSIQLNTYQDLKSRINKLGKNVALFYPLILNQRLELVILTSSRPPIRKLVTISEEIFKTDIENFRKQIQNRDPFIQKSAQALYQKIIQPIEPELTAAGIDTIVYAPDDVMRYIPLAALHDGKQWLAERYRINTLTALALTPLEPDSNVTPHVLAGALTEPYTINILGNSLTFPSLTYTQTEIENLAKILPTTQLINKSFNLANLKQELPNHNILHLATHGYFVSSNPDKSIILLGDGSTISLREIEKQWKLPNMSLVVLSACETAIGGKLGNGIEILGFGYQMQRIGSRASISSLWTIDDSGTQGFMNTFYHHVKQGKSIADAIQQTQKAFITKKITPKTTQALRASGGRYIPNSTSDDFTHPYYWAPFLLIGNGL